MRWYDPHSCENNVIKRKYVHYTYLESYKPSNGKRYYSATYTATSRPAKSAPSFSATGALSYIRSFRMQSIAAPIWNNWRLKIIEERNHAQKWSYDWMWGPSLCCIAFCHRLGNFLQDFILVSKAPLQFCGNRLCIWKKHQKIRTKQETVVTPNSG